MLVKEEAPDMIYCEKHKEKCHSVTKSKKIKKLRTSNPDFLPNKSVWIFPELKMHHSYENWTAELVFMLKENTIHSEVSSTLRLLSG